MPWLPAWPAAVAHALRRTPAAAARLAGNVQHGQPISTRLHTAAAVAALAGASCLTSLETSGRDEQVVAGLASLTRLRHLAVVGVTEQSAESLRDLTSLCHLTSFTLREPMLSFTNPAAPAAPAAQVQWPGRSGRSSGGRWLATSPSCLT